MAPTNMKAIQTTTLTGGSASFIEFTGIPQTYTDLYIKASLRGTGNSTLFIRPNNDAGSNYYTAGAYADNTGQDAFVSTYNYAHGGEMQYATLTANTFSTHEIYISNYAASQRHPIMTQDVQAASTANVYLFMTQTLYNVASPITSVRLVPNTGSIAQYSSVTLYGVTSLATEAYATGGYVTADNNYYYHTFASSGTFTPKQNLTCDYLVVAGGGGGEAGGGGAGGYRTFTSQSLTSSTNYTVTIGAGGTFGNSGNGGGSSGSNSSFSTNSATGGGKGGVWSTSGSNGGSGGGGGNRGAVNGGTGNAGGYSPSEGNNGGNVTGTGTFDAGGGGGGAGGAGETGSNGFNRGGNGGIGATNSISGNLVYYAGGGGGGGRRPGANNTSSGGLGGGGNGGDGTTTYPPSAGVANTGGGGGGQGFDENGIGYNDGANGGSGIVIVRYAK